MISTVVAQGYQRTKVKKDGVWKKMYVDWKEESRLERQEHTQIGARSKRLYTVDALNQSVAARFNFIFSVVKYIDIYFLISLVRKGFSLWILFCYLSTDALLLPSWFQKQQVGMPEYRVKSFLKLFLPQLITQIKVCVCEKVVSQLGIRMNSRVSS